MINILSRSLRVRDDGTGKRREVNGTLAEFENENSIILLGDPGMGKTTLFMAAAKANYTTVRKFLVDPYSAAEGPIFLDAGPRVRSLILVF
jgi:MoxR-like ATPase